MYCCKWLMVRGFRGLPEMKIASFCPTCESHVSLGPALLSHLAGIQRSHTEATEEHGGRCGDFPFSLRAPPCEKIRASGRPFARPYRGRLTSPLEFRHPTPHCDRPASKGWVPEWSIGHAWKACVLQKGTEGSNPSPSAAVCSIRRDHGETHAKLGR